MTKRARAAPVQDERIPDCPYPFWDQVYNEKYEETSETATKILGWIPYFQTYFSSHSPSDTILKIAYKDLVDTNPDFIVEPEPILKHLGLAATSVAAGLQETNQLKVIRVSHHDVITPLKDIKANLMNRFISIQGTVVRVSIIKPFVTQMTFECSTCHSKQTLNMINGVYKPPTKCHIHGCKGKKCLPDRSLTITKDWQKIRIQEKLPNDQSDSGRVPRIIECELTSDLVDSCVPGDVCLVSGIIKVLEQGKKSTEMYQLYLDANFITKVSDEDNHQEKDSLKFSNKDLMGIRSIADEPQVFQRLVNSLCPSIYGHELIKAGLLLALFGGRRRVEPHSMRSDCHVLVVGDPGLGKSQMLGAACKLSPRGVYVCGNSASTAGLTVTLCKDENGDTSIEAGALVLGDQGVCCIDEFDKMTEHQSLLEAMEQQTVSIAKASIVCSLPARTSILAAANPVGGHYNKSKTVSENLKLNGALLSRFDLVFILLDKPNIKMDKFLSDHIMKLHSNAQGSSFMSNTQETNLHLEQRLKSNTGEPIPNALLKKYIAYARMYTNPILTQAAKDVLAEFYQTLRSKYRSPDSTPITTRQLESMIRLAEARARAELREEVTAEDAQDVVELMKYSLWETYEDENGQLDFSRSQHGSSSSKRGSLKKFVTELSRMASYSNNYMFSYERLGTVANQLGIKSKLSELIDQLNFQGFLLKKGNGLYKLSIE